MRINRPKPPQRPRSSQISTVSHRTQLLINTKQTAPLGETRKIAEARSQRISRKSMNKSAVHVKDPNQIFTINLSQIKNDQNKVPLQYYFDPKIKQNIIRKVVDNYLEPSTNNLEISPMKRALINCKTAEQNKRKKTRSTMIQSSILQQFQKSDLDHRNQSLQIIDEFGFSPMKRPLSQQRNPEVTKAPNSFIRNKISKTIATKYDAQTLNNDSSLSFKMKSSKASQSCADSTIMGKNNCAYFQYRKQDDNIGLNKLFKQFTIQGREEYNKQLKIKKLGANVLWYISPSNPYTLIYKNLKPFHRSIYYKIKRNHGSQPIHKIIPYETYFQLFANQNQQLKDIISELCKQTIRLSGKVVSNSIRPSNIFKIAEKQIYIGDWTNAAVRESININGQPIYKNYDPLFREPSTQKIICHPQYLAPEILQAQKSGFQNNTWVYSSAISQSWSIGCLIFQILTLIPLGSPQRYCIKGKNTFRRGLLPVTKFETDQFIRKQKLFCQQYQRTLKNQCNVMITESIWEIIKGCLTFSMSERLRPEQILEILSR